MVAVATEAAIQSTVQSDQRSPLRFIVSHVMRHWRYLILLAIGAMANAVLASVVPYFIGESVTAVESSQPPDIKLGIVATMAIGVVISQLIRSLLQFMRNASAEVFAQRIERDVRDELYASLLGKSMAFHDSQPVGEIMARVTNDVRELNLMMNPGVNLMVGSGMFLVVPVLAAPLIYPDFIWIPLIFVIVHTIVIYLYIRRLHPVAQQVRTNFGVMNTRVAEALEGVEVVKATAQEHNESRYFASLVDAVRDKVIRQGDIEATYLSLFLLGLTIFVAMVVSTGYYQDGLVNTGQVLAYITLLTLFTFPVFTSSFSLTRLASGYASASRILGIITIQKHLDRAAEKRAEDIRGSISFQNVGFAYGDDENPVLEDISFTIDAGQTVALVGQTGSGKSTVTKLINRIYDATQGSVLIDGVDVHEWQLQQLRSQISVIEQDIFLFSRTISENIAFGNIDASKEEIIDAAKRAQAHEFITSFPEGYETIIGQRGVTLSGGQRQRIAIARAFLTNPPILILDDSTSAIDSATEDRIQKAIWAAAKDRTTLLITHRLSQIRWADKIIVLKQGKVVAQGNHNDLLRQSEDYQRIFARYEKPSSHRGTIRN